MAESDGASRPERIGPYDILDVVDSGGMGVVYRARDPRLSRDVALKVIRRTSEGDPRWRQRFADEARAAAALNHPNILVVHDVAIDVDSPYIVSELIDGESLRQELKRGAIRLPRLLDLATQIADALTAAHHAHLIHRDVKPENVMLTRSGRVKVVDFGLAKAIGPANEAGPTLTVTAPHTIVGTPAYMSPEQARGATIDFRSDLFSFGAVLYEMVTGRMAFDRSSSIETLSAILHDDPRPVSELAQNVPSDLQRIIQRCLAKLPDDRYGSTADLLYDLRWVKDHPAPASEDVPADVGARSRLRRFFAGLAAAAMTVAAFVLGWMLKSPAATLPATTELPTWLPLTFEEGAVHSARFAPDGQTILYSADFGRGPYKIYSTTSLRPESRALELPPAGLLAISRSGQLAVSLSCAFQPANGGCAGTLAQAPQFGGAPRPLAQNVRSADWGPDDRLAAVVGGRLEYPLGTPVAEQADHVRVSPDGQRVAWAEARASRIALIVREGSSNRVLSDGWGAIRGIAWAGDGKSVFLTGQAPDGSAKDVLRIGLDGSVHLVLRASGSIRVLDAAANQLLVVQEGSSMRAWLKTGKNGQPRDLSWLGSGVVDAVSDDGQRMLMTVRGGPTLVDGRNDERTLYPIYLRPTDGSAPTYLGGGYGLALSPDGKSALTVTREKPSLVVYPLGPGTARTLDRGDVVAFCPFCPPPTLGTASFASPGLVLFVGQRADGQRQTFTQSIEGGPPAPVSHEPGLVVSPVAPDGRRFVSQRADGSLWVATLTPEPAVRLPFSLSANQHIRQWTEDGQQLFVLTIGDDRDVLQKVDVRTGRRTPHAEVPREQPSIRDFRASFRVSRDGQTIVYTDGRRSSTLFLVQGIR